jgi:hypothetical protein
MNRCVTTVRNDQEAQIILAYLAEAGIHAWPSGPPLTEGVATRDIYVDDPDLDRARQVLKEAQGVSEAELIQAEEDDAARRRQAS